MVRDSIFVQDVASDVGAECDRIESGLDGLGMWMDRRRVLLDSRIPFGTKAEVRDLVGAQEEGPRVAVSCRSELDRTGGDHVVEHLENLSSHNSCDFVLAVFREIEVVLVAVAKEVVGISMRVQKGLGKSIRGKLQVEIHAEGLAELELDPGGD